MSERHQSHNLSGEIARLYPPEDVDFIADINNRVPDIIAQPNTEKLTGLELERIIAERMDQLFDPQVKPEMVDSARASVIADYQSRIADMSLTEEERTACRVALEEYQYSLDHDQPRKESKEEK